MSDLAKDILFQQSRLKGERGTWETHWQQIADRVCPGAGGDFTTLRTPGERRTEKVFDSTASLASSNFTAAIVGMTMPRESKWHGLRSGIEELDRLPAVKLYFERVRDILFYYRYAPASNFVNQSNEAIGSFGIFGTGPFWVDEMPGRDGISYRSVHLSEVFIRENHVGRVDEVYRRSELPARQWAKRWGADALPPAIRQALADDPNRTFEFVQCLRPRADYDPARLDMRRLPIESIVVAVQDATVVKRGGFRTMPLLVPRYQTAVRETYGRSPAMAALPDIKMVNEMTRTLLRAAHRAVAPPLLTADDGVLSRFNLRPDAVNVGGLDHQGRQLVRPLESGGNIGAGMEMADQARKSIERAFMTPLFNILTDTPDRMTATEVLERSKEKAALLAPVAARIEAEMLGPMIERELDILGAMGVLPTMPAELVEAQGEYRVTYDNPLQRAAMSERSIGMMRWVEATAPIAAQKPEIWDIPDWDAWARILAEDNAVPLSSLRTPEAVADDKAQAQQMQEAAQLLQGAEIAGNAAKSLAQAQQIAGAPGV